MFVFFFLLKTLNAKIKGKILKVLSSYFYLSSYSQKIVDIKSNLILIGKW